MTLFHETVQPRNSFLFWEVGTFQHLAQRLVCLSGCCNTETCVNLTFVVLIGHCCETLSSQWSLLGRLEFEVNLFIVEGQIILSHKSDPAGHRKLLSQHHLFFHTVFNVCPCLAMSMDNHGHAYIKKNVYECLIHHSSSIICYLLSCICFM